MNEFTFYFREGIIYSVPGKRAEMWAVMKGLPYTQNSEMVGS